MVILVKEVSKKFGDITVFDNFSMKVKEREFLAIQGVSGSGKSTLLNMLGLLDTPDSGTITLFGQDNIKPFSKQAEKVLKNEIGYLFQNFALIENETVYYNLMLTIEHYKMKDKTEKIKKALMAVGLTDYERKYIYQCSGGEQQRIAIARLLIKPCNLILADEPTGSLDEENKMEIFQLLKKLQDQGKTILMVSHDQELIEKADRIIAL